MGGPEIDHLINLLARLPGFGPRSARRAALKMLQQPEADDYVVATGETHSVGEFCELAFATVGLDYRKYVIEDENFYRPAEVDLLVGDSSKAREVFGWKPKYTFQALVKEMVEADVQSISSKKS